jgi:hypothetical protein
MALDELLQARTASIAKRWLEETLRTYDPHTASHLLRERDPFANPVGHALITGTQAVVDGLAAGSNPQELASGLGEIIKIRSVQDFTPAQAVSFILLLKEVIRNELGSGVEAPDVAEQLRRFDARVDQLLLVGFDLYTHYRERMYEVRVNDIKRRVSGLMRQMGMSTDDPEPGPDVPETALRR